MREFTAWAELFFESLRTFGQRFMGAILGAAAISYGFASKDLLANLLAGFFSRQSFHPGQVIEIDGVRGKIIKATNISIVIENDKKEKVVIPCHELITNKVKILE